jgi:glycine/sarcosine N-methyltransferase
MQKKEKSNFFYDPELYDLQTNWSARLSKEKEFFREIISENNIKSILDIGCGTGHHAQLFSDLLNEMERKGTITAVDPAEETIAYAAKNIIKSENITLKVGGFENLETLISGENFDLITCLGNTLPLLKTRKKVKFALKATRKKLSEKGIAVFQFLNFEPEVIEKERFYRPKLFKKGDVRYFFMKHFEYGKINTRADFLITELGTGDEILDFYINSSYMCTLRKNLFLKMADNSGFKTIRLTGPGGNEIFDKKKHVSLNAVMSRH